MSFSYLPVQKIADRDYFDIVPRDALMDPESESIKYADTLVSGELVLLAASRPGVDASGRALVDSRWCLVTNKRVNKDVRVTTFIGVYSDGTQAVRKHGNDTGFLVKKVSVRTSWLQQYRLSYLASSGRYVKMPDTNIKW